MNVVWDLEYFWDVCPFSLDDLKKRNRKRARAYWRQVAMYVARRSGMSHEESAGLFGFDHSTSVYAVKCVESAMEGYNGMQNAMIQEYINRAPKTESLKNIHPTEDVCVNEMIGLTIMDGMQASRMNF